MTTDLYSAMTVDLPESELDGLHVKRFTVESSASIQNIRLAFHGGRSTRPGTYTKLLLNGRLWMSDTDAEKRDHLKPLREMQRVKARRVLINGLGLGMVVKATLTMEHVEHVDVVERDNRVVNLIGKHYVQDSRVVVHHADAYEQARRWPAGTRWDVAWSDIWPDLCTDNLESMARLRRSYGRRTGWHDCWGRDLLLLQRSRERQRGW